MSTHNICLYKENQKQEKHLTALWTSFLNNEESKSSLSCMWNIYWSSSSSLPNMEAIIEE